MKKVAPFPLPPKSISIIKIREQSATINPKNKRATYPKPPAELVKTNLQNINFQRNDDKLPLSPDRGNWDDNQFLNNEVYVINKNVNIHDSTTYYLLSIGPIQVINFWISVTILK